MSNEYKEWLKEQTFESLANDNLRIKLELQTAKEENENLKKLIRKLAIDKIEFDRLKRNETDKVDYSFGQIETLTQQNEKIMEQLNTKYLEWEETFMENQNLTQQNKQMMEALEEISGCTQRESEFCRTQDDCSFCRMHQAQQALKGEE